MDVKMEASWKEVLKNEFTKPYFQQIVTFLKTEKAAGKLKPDGRGHPNVFADREKLLVYLQRIHKVDARLFGEV